MKKWDLPLAKMARQFAWVISFALVAAVTLVAPASASGSSTSNDIFFTARTYVTTFYPIWFTHTQIQVAPRNKLIGPATISPVYQSVVAINDDTLYASSAVDVRNGPVYLYVPETVTGYSVLLLDPYGNVYPSGVPSKAAGVATPDTTYAVVGPNYSGTVAPGTVTVHLPLNVMVLIFRVDKFANGVDETAEATAFRADLSIDGLSTLVIPVADYAFGVKTLADTLIGADPVLFLQQMQAAIGDASWTPPLTGTEQILSDHFNALFGNGLSLTQPEQAMFAAGVRSAHSAILNNYLNNRDFDNWIHFTNIGQWHQNVLDRASITEFCQYCNTIDTAAYYHAFLDGDGAALSGSNAGGYVLTFPPGGAPEASRFWSITAYTPGAVELMPNVINKYVVASYTPGLVSNPDGSISIYISKTKPAGVAEANWLPVSDGAFNVMLRVYGVVPHSAVAINRYVPPPIIPAN